MKRKKIISLLLLALMLVTMFSGMQITASAATWSGKAASSFAGGKGTKSSPYIIKTGEQLARMRNLINSNSSGSYDYRHAYYKLGANIVLNSNSSKYASWGSSAPANKWTPIGYDNWFYGSFDGNGYTISGLYIKSSCDYVGLFGGSEGNITNVKITNSYISGSGYDTAAVVGVQYGTSPTETKRISGCSVSSTIVKGTKTTGGIVGSLYSNASLYNCTNSATVSSSGEYYNVGGVAGSATIKEKNSFYSNTNNGKVSGSGYVGGVCGGLTVYNTSVYSLKNKGAVTSTGSQAGGICGDITSYSKCTVSKSYNSAPVKGASNVGGLFGTANSYSSLTVNQCTTTDGSTVTATKSTAGGLIGRMGAYVYSNIKGVITLKNSNSGAGKVSTTESAAGGFLGQISTSAGCKATVSNCISKAQVSAASEAGAIAGDIYNTAGTVKIYKNAVLHAASADKYVGYIAGYVINQADSNSSITPVLTAENNYYTYSWSLGNAFGYVTYNSVAATLSNNSYTNESNLYDSDFCAQNLGIYPCAWKFDGSSVPVVSVALSHSYKTVTKRATTSANGSITKTCTYCGAKSVTTIKKISSVKLSATSYKYNNKVKTPSVIVKDSSGKVLKKGTDYKVTYPSGRKKVGTYKVKVTFIGKYSGSKTLTFKIKK